MADQGFKSRFNAQRSARRALQNDKAQEGVEFETVKDGGLWVIRMLGASEAAGVAVPPATEVPAFMGGGTDLDPTVESFLDATEGMTGAEVQAEAERQAGFVKALAAFPTADRSGPTFGGPTDLAALVRSPADNFAAGIAEKAKNQPVQANPQSAATDTAPAAETPPAAKPQGKIAAIIERAMSPAGVSYKEIAELTGWTKYGSVFTKAKALGLTLRTEKDKAAGTTRLYASKRP